MGTRHTTYFMDKEYPNIAGGGGGGGFDSAVIYEGTQRESTINLDDDYTNYDYLLIQGYAAGGGGYLNTSLVKVSEIATNNHVGIYDNGSYIWYFCTNVNTLTLDIYNGDYYIRTIYGLKIASSGGGGSEVEPNPQGTPTDTLTTIGIGGTIYEIAGGGEPTKTLVYQLGAGGRWETFSNPHSSKKLLIEAEGYGIVRGGEFEPTLLPAREGGDNFVTIANTPVGNLAINLGQMGSGETIYISTNGGYDTNIQTVRVYKLD